MIVIEDQIKFLIKLHNMDYEIFKLKNDKIALPAEINILENAFKEKEAVSKSVDDKLKSALLKRKEKEVELEGKENSIKKLQSQLSQVKTNKEYSSIEHEIASIKADNSVLEENIIKLFDEIDALKAELTKEKEILKIEEGKLSAEKKVVDDKIKEIDSMPSKKEAERAELANSIDKQLLSKYERILRNKEDGIAMVEVKGNACQGCFMNMPPQVIYEIRMKQSLVFCENCARILYIEE